MVARWLPELQPRYPHNSVPSLERGPPFFLSLSRGSLENFPSSHIPIPILVMGKGNELLGWVLTNEDSPWSIKRPNVCKTFGCSKHESDVVVCKQYYVVIWVKSIWFSFIVPGSQSPKPLEFSKCWELLRCLSMLMIYLMLTLRVAIYKLGSWFPGEPTLWLEA